MSATLHAQSPITLDEARRYLQDQGFPSDGFDLLTMHINAITSLILNVTGLDRIKWIDNDTISEYRDGDGSNELWLKNAPVRRVVSVQINPLATTAGTTYTGPTEPALSNADMLFDTVQGIIVLKKAVFPEGRNTALVQYEAGYFDGVNASPADHEFEGLRVTALDALATKWARWSSRRHGILSETKREMTVSYTDADFSEHALKDLRRFRRHLFA